jgi:hypothetical protein
MRKEVEIEDAAGPAAHVVSPVLLHRAVRGVRSADGF